MEFLKFVVKTIGSFLVRNKELLLGEAIAAILLILLTMGVYGNQLAGNIFIVLFLILSIFGLIAIGGGFDKSK